MMHKKIFIHIGLRKTATTSIQTSLANNYSALLEQGVLYPQTFLRSDAHHELGFKITGDKRHNPKFGKLEQLKQEINQSQAEKVIISSEVLAPVNIDQINELRDTIGEQHDYTIIAFLRRQDLWLQSLWSQLAKTEFVVNPFDKYLEKVVAQQVDPEDPYSTFILKISNPDFYTRIHTWEQAFGTENIRMRVFEKDLMGKNVFTEFLKILQVEDPEKYPYHTNPNSSPGAKTLAVVQYFVNELGENKFKKTPTITHHIAFSIRAYAQEHGWDQEKFNGITKEIHDDLAQRYADSNRKIAQTYFGRDQLFLEPFIEKPLTNFRIEDLDSTELLEITSYVINRLVNSPRYADTLIKKHGLAALSLPELNPIEKEIASLTRENQLLEQEYQAILNSRSWKTLGILRKLYQPFHRLFGRSAK